MKELITDVVRRIDGEQSFDLTAYRRYFPRRPPSHSTLLLWVKVGVYPAHRLRGDTSIPRVRLEAYRDGGRWITSVEAVYRFRQKLGGE